MPTYFRRCSGIECFNGGCGFALSFGALNHRAEGRAQKSAEHFVNLADVKVSEMIASLCWAVLGLVHALPALALFRPSLIGTLYGVDPGSTTFVLLHHRAALFLVVVIVCGWATLRPEVRPLASITVAISMGSFLWLFAAAGQPVALRQIAIADLIGLPFLGIAAWLAFRPAAGS